MRHTVADLIRELQTFDPNHEVVLDMFNAVSSDFVLFGYEHDFNEPDNLDVLDDVEWSRSIRPVVCLSALIQDGT